MKFHTSPMPVSGPSCPSYWIGTTEFFKRKIYDAAMLIGSKLQIQWTVKSLIKFIKPFQYWLMGSLYCKKEGNDLDPILWKIVRETFTVYLNQIRIKSNQSCDHFYITWQVNSSIALNSTLKFFLGSGEGLNQKATNLVDSLTPMQRMTVRSKLMPKAQKSGYGDKNETLKIRKRLLEVDETNDLN